MFVIIQINYDNNDKKKKNEEAAPTERTQTVQTEFHVMVFYGGFAGNAIMEIVENPTSKSKVGISRIAASRD